MMNQPQPQYGGAFPTPQQRKGCWGRNWKWIVPTGCLGLILLVVAIGVGIFFVAMSAIKSSEIYQGALSRARSSPVAVERLGEPITDGWYVKGNVKLENGSGRADLEIPVSGPKKSGTLYVEAVSEPGTSWMFETLDLAVEGDRVSLLEHKLVTPPPPPPPGSSENENESGDGSSSPSGGKTVSGGVLNDKATSKPQPPYPPIAKAARAQGTVTVQVMVDESGNVISATAVSGHPLLQAAAVAAARQAKFAPYKLSGQPVKVSGVLTYNFVLE